MAVGYLGFMAYNAHFILSKHVYPSRPSSSSLSLLAPSLGAAIFALLSLRFQVERSPPSYYLYAFFPCFFWASILRDPWPFAQLFREAQAEATISQLLGGTIAVIGVLQIMVFGYSVREVFAALLLGMGSAWPALGMKRKFVEREWKLVGAYAVACVVLAVFPLLPVEKGESIMTM